MQDPIDLRTLIAFFWQKKVLFISLSFVAFALSFGYQFYQFKGPKLEKKYFAKSEMAYINYSHLLNLRLLFLHEPQIITETRFKLEEQNIKLSNSQISNAISIKLQDIGNMPASNGKYVNAYMIIFYVQHPNQEIASKVLQAWTEVCYQEHEEELENLKLYVEELKAEQSRFFQKEKEIDAQMNEILNRFNAPTLANLKERSLVTTEQSDKLINQLLKAELQLKALSTDYPKQVLESAQNAIQLSRHLLNHQSESTLLRNFEQATKTKIGRELNDLESNLNLVVQGLISISEALSINFATHTSSFKSFLQHTKAELQNTIARLDTLQADKNAVTESQNSLFKEIESTKPKIFRFENMDEPKVVFSRRDFLISSIALSLSNSFLLSCLSVLLISIITQQNRRH